MMNVECMNKVDNIYNDGEETVIDIKSMPYFDLEQYDLMDEKDFRHYINDLERVVRNSFEYRSLIRYLKNIEGISFVNLTSKDVVRHPLVQRIVKAYEKFEEEQNKKKNNRR